MEKNRKKFKKALAVILALAMIISLVNVPAIGSEAASKKKTVKSITVSNLPAKTLTLKKNKTFQLKTKVTVTGKASKAVIYKSSKPKVAIVNSKGKIKAKKNGKTVITITSKVNKSKKCKITVTVGTPATKVSIKASKNYVAVGKTLKLKATVTPKKASNKKVIWSSSNKKVATVTSKGVVKGIKSGTATITAKAADGSGKKAKFKVNVVTPVKISIQDLTGCYWEQNIQCPSIFEFREDGTCYRYEYEPSDDPYEAIANGNYYSCDLIYYYNIDGDKLILTYADSDESKVLHYVNKSYDIEWDVGLSEQLSEIGDTEYFFYETEWDESDPFSNAMYFKRGKLRD